MGNVGASSKPIQDPKFDLTMDLPKESKEKKPLENPGTMEELHKRCKGRNFILLNSSTPFRNFYQKTKIDRFQPLT